jgi:hypothetical protein
MLDIKWIRDNAEASMPRWPSAAPSLWPQA